MTFIFYLLNRFGGISMISTDSCVKKDSNVAWRIVEGNAFLVSPKDSMMYPLNPVGTKTWQLLDGKVRVKNIIDNICQEFAIDRMTAEKDITAFIRSLLDAGLAAISEPKINSG